MNDVAMRADAFMDVERPWLDLELEEARDLLLERGVSVSRADGIVGWLSDQRRGRRLHSKDTIVAYRKVLREVGCPRHTFRGSSTGRACGC